MGVKCYISERRYVTTFLFPDRQFESRKFHRKWSHILDVIWLWGVERRAKFIGLLFFSFPHTERAILVCRLPEPSNRSTLLFAFCFLCVPGRGRGSTALASVLCSAFYRRTAHLRHKLPAFILWGSRLWPLLLTPTLCLYFRC